MEIELMKGILAGNDAEHSLLCTHDNLSSRFRLMPKRAFFRPKRPNFSV